MVTKLLEDTIEFQTVPFKVTVEKRNVLLDNKDKTIHQINMYGAPKDGSSSAGKTLVEAIEARVRPDYPYSIDERWPENVDKHFLEYELLETVESKPFALFFTSYDVVSREPERTPKEVGKDCVRKMKKAYEDRTEVEALDD